MIRKLGEITPKLKFGRNVDNSVLNLNLRTGREIALRFSKKIQDGGQLADYYILTHIFTSTEAITWFSARA